MRRPTTQDVSERPFVYGLQRVRDLRAREEEQAQEALARTIAWRRKGEAQLRAATERLQAARRPSSHGETASAASLVARQQWTERLERTAAEAAQDLASREAAVVAQRREVAERAQRREVLDRLRERKLDEHRTSQARVEAATMDEIALRQWSAA